MPNLRFAYVILVLAHLAPTMSNAQETIYDEDNVPKYTLPDPLLTNEGSPITSAAQWPDRREEVLKLFKRHVFGTMPEFDGKHAVTIDAKVTQELIVTFAVDPSLPDSRHIQGYLREITLKLKPEKQVEANASEIKPTVPLELRLLVVTPVPIKNNGKPQKYPVFLGYNFLGNHTLTSIKEVSLAEIWNAKTKQRVIPDEKQRGERINRWPIGMMLQRGMGLVTLHYGDVDPDFDDGFNNGAHRLFPDLQNRSDNWSSIGAWAWGLHRVLDYLETDSHVNANSVVAFGHSRLGKTSLWAGATDERLIAVISNNSGCGGAALSRRRFGESVKRINTSFPHWFCKQHREYNDNESASPVDHHMLLSLSAPRGVYVASAEGDRWADPYGEFLSTYHASRVFEMLGQDGLQWSAKADGKLESPPNNTSIGKSIRYHIRDGKHNVTRYDWAMYLNFAKDIVYPKP